MLKDVVGRVCLWLVTVGGVCAASEGPGLGVLAREAVAKGDLTAVEVRLSEALVGLGRCEREGIWAEFLGDSDALAETLTEVAAQLGPARGALDELAAYLDWYPHDDWVERFGATDFYAQVQHLRQMAVLEGCMAAYYEGVAAAVSGAERPGGLAEGAAALAAWLGEDEVDEAAAGELRLWWARLRRLTGADGAPGLRGLLKESGGLAFEGQLELMRWAALRGEADGEDLRRLAKAIEAWLDGRAGALENGDWLRLRLILVEEVLAREVGAAVSVGTLKRLERLGADWPAGRGMITELVARQALGRKADALRGFEVRCLLRYWQDESERAIELAETVLVQETLDRETRGWVLFELGRQYYAMGKAAEAAERWRTVAEEFGGWRCEWEGETRNAVEAARRGAAAGYALWREDKVGQQVRARRCLATLVGTVRCEQRQKAGQGVLRKETETVCRLAGRYAETAAAKAWRYGYGLVLMAEEDYAAARVAFAAVGADEVNKAAARYYAVLAGYKGGGGTRVEWKAELKALLAGEVEEEEGARAAVLWARLCLEDADALGSLRVLDRHRPGRGGEEGTALEGLAVRIEACEQLGRYGEAGEAVAELLVRFDESAAVVRTAVRFLVERRDGVLKRHAEDEAMTLISELRALTDVTRRVRMLVDDGVAVDTAVREAAERAWLELGALAVYVQGRAGGAGLRLVSADGVAALEDVMAERTEKLGGQVWFVRCAALMAMGRAEYVEARRQWRRIRQATEAGEDAAVRFAWWEARALSLECLVAEGLDEDVAHIVEVALHSREDGPGVWRGRLVAFERAEGTTNGHE